MTAMQHLARALAIQEISRYEGENDRIGAALAVLRGDTRIGIYDDHPACARAARENARLRAMSPSDMPPTADDVALLLETASQRLGGVSYGQVWESIGVTRNRGRNFLSERGIGAVDWPIFFTLRAAALR